MPMRDRTSVARARELGYRDVEAMTSRHDLLHSMLAAWLGLPASPVLERKASGKPMTAKEANAEESAVLAIARLCNQHGLDPLEIAARMSKE